MHHPIGADGGNVARRKPAIHQGCIFGLVVVVNNPLTTHHEFALRFAITWQGIAILIHNFELNAKHRFALFSDQIMSQGIRPSLLFVVHIADGGNSCGLGHAPTVSHIHLVHIAELGNQGFGHGGTAHASSAHGGEAQIVLFQVLNQAHPNRWDTGAQGDFF